MYKRQISSIRQYLETGKGSEDLKEFIQDQKNETQIILNTVIESLNKTVAPYQDRVNVYFLDHPDWSLYTLGFFDPFKRSSVKVMIIGDNKSTGVVKQALLSEQYGAGNISLVEDFKKAATALNSFDTLPEIIVFQGVHAAWQDQEWLEFISACKLKGKSVFVGLDTGDAADDFKSILPNIERWLGLFTALQKSKDGADGAMAVQDEQKAADGAMLTARHLKQIWFHFWALTDQIFIQGLLIYVVVRIPTR